MAGNVGLEGVGLYSRGTVGEMTLRGVEVSGQGSILGGAIKLTGNITRLSEKYRYILLLNDTDIYHSTFKRNTALSNGGSIYQVRYHERTVNDDEKDGPMGSVGIYICDVDIRSFFRQIYHRSMCHLKICR